MVFVLVVNFHSWHKFFSLSISSPLDGSIRNLFWLFVSYSKQPLKQVSLRSNLSFSSIWQCTFELKIFTCSFLIFESQIRDDSKYGYDSYGQIFFLKFYHWFLKMVLISFKGPYKIGIFLKFQRCGSKIEPATPFWSLKFKRAWQA